MRKKRILGKSQIYHIILRGNNKRNIYFDENDYLFFISQMSKYAEELNIDIYAYCLMTNHVHILLGKANDSLSLFVQKLATSYAMHFNRKYDCCGHLFQDRFKSEPVETDDYLKVVLRYILLNPEKAKMVRKCKDYKWSSYLAILKHDNSILNSDYVIDLFGNVEAFLEFINEANSDKCMEYENKVFLSDLKCIKIIKSIFGLENPTAFIKMDPEIQKKNLSYLKETGMTVSQLSRLTGISRKIIQIA